MDIENPDGWSAGLCHRHTSHDHRLAVDNDGAVVGVDGGGCAQIEIGLTGGHVELLSQAIGWVDLVAA